MLLLAAVAAPKLVAIDDEPKMLLKRQFRSKEPRRYKEARKSSSFQVLMVPLVAHQIISQQQSKGSIND